MAEKRARTQNFSVHEVETLVTLVEIHKDIIGMLKCKVSEDKILN